MHTFDSTLSDDDVAHLIVNSSDVEEVRNMEY